VSLRVRYVSSLSDIVGPVAAWIHNAPTGRSLFEPDHLLLPTNGAKAWLLPELAKQVGAREGCTDGVVANVQVGYLGSLNKFIAPQRYRDIDPWSIESMTGVILGVIAGDPQYAAVIARAGGALQAASRLADRFDRYHARRPMMIRAWEKGSPVLAPTTADSFNDGEWRAAELGEQQWQFDLWRQVRDTIGVPSWPARIEAAVQQLRRGENIVGIPGRLMVAGMQSLSFGAIELLDAFGHVSDVEVLLVHPSPELAQRWAAESASIEVRRGALQLRPNDEDLPDNVHPMSHAWLRGARELQQMLVSQGIAVEPHEPSPIAPSAHLLDRIKTAVAGNGLEPRVDRTVDDLSVQVHRCYSLTRQVEVLHDALLHTFRDLKDLAPHQVVIVSPRLAEATPILDAVFNRTVTVEVDGVEKEMRIPLAIAERQLRFINPGAEFLAALLELMTSRFDISSFLNVATSSLVSDHLGINADHVDVWKRQIERTRVYWGLSAQQRTAAGLDPEVEEAVENAHTWKSTVERALLGAAVPDAAPAAELGGVVPLTDVGVDDLDALSRLVQIFDIIETLDQYCRQGEDRGLGEWCVAVEEAARSLCGDSDKVSGAFELLGSLRSSATLQLPDGAAQPTGAAVPFAEVATHLLNAISGIPGHQPLRTGAVTATSLMPLRGVPYRVVCLLGIDDGVFGGGELESDDLVGRQVFIGDDDPRIDARRQLLDSVLAADEQVIITCDGRSIQNNTNIPLTTALAEFVDFARRHGVADRDEDKGTEIEFLHPRHATSPRNFALGGVVPGRVWSHSVGTREIARKVGVDIAPGTVPGFAASSPSTGVVELASLCKFVRSPLRMFVNDILGVNTWRDKEQADHAVIPFAIDSKSHQNFVTGYIRGKAGLVPSWSPEAHVALARLNGDVPVGAYGNAVVSDMTAIAESIVATCATHSVVPVAPDPTPVLVSLADGLSLKGLIPHLQQSEKLIGVVKSTDKYDIDHIESALRLLVATAAGIDVRCAITVHAHEKKAQASARLVYLGDVVDQDEAKRRVLQLVKLRAVASTQPMPSFGDTVDAVFSNPAQPDFDRGRTVFDKFVDGERYASTLEHSVYGDQPQFNDVFDPEGTIVAFWSQFHQALHLTRAKATGNATNIASKLPHGGSHWGIL
jgi:exodeoxyribonuclease V gamma subunit